MSLAAAGWWRCPLPDSEIHVLKDGQWCPVRLTSGDVYLAVPPDGPVLLMKGDTVVRREWRLVVAGTQKVMLRGGGREAAAQARERKKVAPSP